MGGAVALKKTTKSKLHSSPWRSLKWESRMQLVEIVKVFQSDIKVMHPSKQLNKEVKTLDDVRSVEFANEALVMWGSEYLVEVCPPKLKGKMKPNR